MSLSTIQSIIMRASQPINQSIIMRASQPINLSIHHHESQSAYQSVNQSSWESVSLSISQSIIMRACQTINQSTMWFTPRYMVNQMLTHKSNYDHITIELHLFNSIFQKSNNKKHHQITQIDDQWLVSSLLIILEHSNALELYIKGSIYNHLTFIHVMNILPIFIKKCWNIDVS